MADKLKKGDRVEWRYAQHMVRGTVEKKLTAPARIKSHTVAARPEHPEYLVKTEKTGALAAHSRARSNASRAQSGRNSCRALPAILPHALGVTCRTLPVADRSFFG